ncbi:MAG: 50S ribosomal protein L17 [Parcubacteria group bacterium]|jgi:large subunit ribosomal protein L17
MQHLRKGRKFGRVKNQREAMLKTLLGSLIMEEKIETSEAKAKEIKGMIDKIVNKAKQTQIDSPAGGKKLAAIRDLGNRIPAAAVKKMTGEFLSKFSGRTSGYTRIIKLSPRQSDSARIAIIEFV